MSCFTRAANASQYLNRVYGITVPQENISMLVASKLLPAFEDKDGPIVAKSDLNRLATFFTLTSNKDSFFKRKKSLLSQETIISIKTDNGTEFEFLDLESLEPVAFAALKNIFINIDSLDIERREGSSITLRILDSITITTPSQKLVEYVLDIDNNASILMSAKSSHFANTAYYMGSKKVLSPYLCEAIAGNFSQKITILDLMCGSGAASAGFSRFWQTFASDAQGFCTTLAEVQGGGFTVQEANSLVVQLSEAARMHTERLILSVGEFVQLEEEIFHSHDYTLGIERYRSFIDRFPTYPSRECINGWEPFSWVNSRKENLTKAPYCLFTAYFANVYFSLRQCVEIDSIRYAIDQIKDHNHKRWALGALIAAISNIGTTYGGHFAQPPASPSSKITENTFFKIIEKRSFSVMHEFSARLLSLASESESTPNQITPIPGPWSQAIEQFSNLKYTGDVIVYIDPPYTRDEYSRYYHILETLIKYDYPSSTGKGRIPSKKNGERFSSSFFTRSKPKMESEIIKILDAVLSNRLSLAWSYSSSADAHVPRIVDQLAKKHNIETYMYAAPYTHKAQGGRKAKRVTEYLIILKHK